MCQNEIYLRNPDLLNFKSKVKLILKSIYGVRVAQKGEASETLKNFEEHWKSSKKLRKHDPVSFLIFKISPKLVGLVTVWEIGQKIRWKIYSTIINQRSKQGR
jgi:hypothetical protein